MYVDVSKNEQSAKAKLLVDSSLYHRFLTVEAIYELSQYTDDPMMLAPWPGTSAWNLAGLAGSDPGPGLGKRRGSKTPLMPDSVFSSLYQAAWSLIEQGGHLLDLRDQLDLLSKYRDHQSANVIGKARKRYLVANSNFDNMDRYEEAIIDLRTACYIVVASLSGCRNHELAYIQTNAYYSTEDDNGEVYWWMKSRSTKTDEGYAEWMMPEAAVAALKMMDRWAKSYQIMLEDEIVDRRAANPADLEIAEAQRHLSAVFLGKNSKKSNQVRTLSITSWNSKLCEFAKRYGIDWSLSTHQFRRKFANYAARSQFGDLRYLKEHFKHWSLDMTLSYALNESQEMALYCEIQDELDEIKDNVVTQWLRPNEPLAGGYGRGIMEWRGAHEVTIFRDHKTMVRSIADSTFIRSNGHAWCTADDNLCIGNGGLEGMRCTECNSAVIGREHAHIYKGAYDHLSEVLKCDDIGSGGQARVQRDLDRCRDALNTLGYKFQEQF